MRTALKWIPPALFLLLAACSGSGGGQGGNAPAAPGFTLGLSPATVTTAQGATAVATATVTPQAGFAGAVNLAVTGLPAGVTAAFAPASTGATSTLTLTVASGAAAGSYPLTVSGTATGAQGASATLALTVNAAPSAGFMFSFMPRQWGRDVIFLAYQDGSGPWTPVLPSGGLYQFNMTSAKGAVAFTTRSRQHADDIYTAVTYGSVDSLKHLNDPPPLSEVDVQGTFSGVPAAQNVSVALGEGGVVNVATTTPTGAWAISGAVGGAQTDLLATLSGQTGLGRSILRRGLDLTAASPNLGGDLDFGGSEAFDQVSYPLTGHGLSGGTPVSVSAYSHLKTPGLDAGVINGTTSIGSIPPSIGLIPASQLRAGDLLAVGMSAMLLSESLPSGIYLTQISQAYMDQPQAVDLAFQDPAPLPGLTVIQNAPVPRVRIASSIASPYGSAFTAVLVQSQNQAQGQPQSTWARGWILLVDASFCNPDQTFQVDLPDFTSLTGWDSTWAFQVSTTAVPMPLAWSTTFEGRSWSSGQPVSGSTQVTSSYGGQTPLQ